MDKSRLTQILSQFAKQRVLVVGDAMLDKYLWCSVSRISPEAPVPVATVTSESYKVGGAANVANNVVALGGKATYIGVVGNDDEGCALRQAIQDCGVTADLIQDDSRPTTVKTRVVCGSQQLLRFDREDARAISSKANTELLSRFRSALDASGLVVISDYAKGVISPSLSKAILKECNDKKRKTLVDPKMTTWESLRNAYLVKPNRKEAEEIAGKRFEPGYTNLDEIGHILEDKFRSKVIVTLGEDGMAVFDDDEIVRIPTLAREVYDVSGAGDSVMAALGLSLSAGVTPEEAAFIGNLAAGVVVRKLGTATCNQDELLEQYGQLSRTTVTRAKRKKKAQPLSK